ncbi:TPR-like protein [Fomitiporia mediterranea MF3/22]|uniref:TPR-like protein n=1 Tax=Fomitiporia mediterranea (strain MF3/22) TaxID=694068 RepID=R7SG70_FOMME|nr:TPR-like protein [Fomitiporia mediterranea MF3/22]EJC97708.1 TPR-like protein [Fomitiporia mediterranea MF3/22]
METSSTATGGSFENSIDLDDPWTHHKLALKHWERFEQSGEQGELEISITHDRTALKLRPEGHLDRSKSLYNLALSLSARYERWGQSGDLEEAIELNRAALELLPEGHPDRSTSLNNLAGSLSSRYKRHGRTEDLEEAIQLERAALELRPEGNPERSTNLNNVACCLFTRYKQQGRAEDLEEILNLHRAALELRPEGHPLRSSSLDNLANSLSTRFEQYGMTDDLEEAIGLQRAALELLPKGHPDRSMTLNNLANSLLTRYKQQGSAEDLEEAINLHRSALELHSECHPNRSTPLSNLASSLSIRFKQYGKTDDLEEAIQLGRASVALRPEGHPDRTTSLVNLTDSLLTRIEKRWQVEEFEECIQLLELAATHSFSGSLGRLIAAQGWAALARPYSHSTTFTAYQTALSILQHALTVNPTLRAQHDFLLRNSDHRILSLDAASYAIEKDQLEQAVEILDQGRGLLWSQLRGLRSPLDQLAETNEGLAKRFRTVSRRLEDLAISHEALVPVSTINRGDRSHRLDGELGWRSFDELLKLKRQLSREQEDVINEIRRVQGFENFLEAIPFKVLRQASSEGPVIVVNHSEYRCDALIILSTDDSPVVCVSLDDKFFKDSINLCNELLEARRSSGAASHDYNEKLREVMKMLWDRVVSKVVEKLKEVGIAEGSRIWWCPTSVLSALPFHAAGPFKDEDGTTKYLLDDYISSYTPTLAALINARSNGNSIEPKLLVVGDTKTLNSTRQEIRNIRNCTGESILERTMLLDNKASRSTVMENLQKATWIHFACHGHLDAKPFDSSFKLSDRGLTLLDIIQANVPNAEFAFLSACHTAELSHSGAHDEALHLAAAMQFSGFRSVIGTMWELYDEDGPCVAKAVYEHMNECEDGNVRYKMAAAGLRRAALELRAKDWIPTERWVNFVHIGA